MTNDQMIDKLNGYILVVDEAIKSCGDDAVGARAEYIKTMAELMKVRVMLSKPYVAPVASAPAPVSAPNRANNSNAQQAEYITLAKAQEYVQSGCPNCGGQLQIRTAQKTGNLYIACASNTRQKNCFYHGIRG